jgi:hypothetical protein
MVSRGADSARATSVIECHNAGFWLNQIETWFSILAKQALEGQSSGAVLNSSRTSTDSGTIWLQRFDGCGKGALT